LAPESELSRDNHAVPQAYLKGWSDDGGHVLAYRTLVPDDRYPEWSRRSVRSLAAYRDLYTSIASGAESDEFERWMNESIEGPAAEAIELVRENRRLSPEHWKRLVFYAAALDLRTPSSYAEQNERWNREIPGILADVMQSLPERLRSYKPPGGAGPAPRAENPFPVRVTTERQPGGGGIVRAEVVTGREMWLHTMRHQLTTLAPVLTRHRWVMLRPAEGLEWFTSDHPLLRLNYYADGTYDFGGGWGNPGSEILLPISPGHLMYTQVGRAWPGPLTLGDEMTVKLQRLLAERAHRWIIANRQIPAVRVFRPRHVDRGAFDAEARAWREWHHANRSAAQGKAIMVSPAPQLHEVGDGTAQ
jgi:hypothetical protein